MNKKRVLAIITAITVACMSLTGCAESNTSQNTQTGSASTESTDEADMSETGNSGDNKLVIAIQTDSNVSDYDDNYLTNYMEDKLGMEIEFYQLPVSAEEVNTKVSLMATSNTNLPDVLIVDNALTPETILEYGSNGVFLPLNEYVSDASKMPNYNAIPENDRNQMMESQTMADGNMYSLAKFEPETWNLTPYRMFLNQSWLNQLGLSMPKTTDDLMEVLKAFRNQDPNGNGKKDEIGVYGFQSGGYGEDITAALMNSFEFWNGDSLNGGLSLDQDGKNIIAPFTTEGWKAGLKYMNELYREGLLSPAIFTDDGTQFKATLNEEDNVVGLTSFGSLSNYPDAINNKNFLEMTIIEPLSGPDGTCYTPYTEYSPNQTFFIFSSCKNVDLAIRLADEFYSQEGSTIARFGEEGVDWTGDPEALAGMSNEFVASGMYDQLTLAYISNYWLEPSNKTWHGVSPRYASLETMNTVANGMTEFDPGSPVKLQDESYEYYYSNHPDKVLPLLHYTADEARQIQGAVANIPSYVKQAMAEFITGSRDIDSGWDSYLEELNGMGLAEWISCAQSAYNRGDQ